MTSLKKFKGNVNVNLRDDNGETHEVKMSPMNIRDVASMMSAFDDEEIKNAQGKNPEEIMKDVSAQETEKYINTIVEIGKNMCMRTDEELTEDEAEEIVLGNIGGFMDSITSQMNSMPQGETRKLIKRPQGRKARKKKKSK